MYISITKLSQTHHFLELFSKVLVRGVNYKLLEENRFKYSLVSHLWKVKQGTIDNQHDRFW
jgi:hypothetical protein